MTLLSAGQSLVASSTVTFKIGLAHTGKVRIDDGVNVNTYDTTATTDDGRILQVSNVPTGTVVTMEALTAGLAPQCADPGQSFTITSGWASVITNCGSGWAYKADVTIDSTPLSGFLSWNAFA
jgi:hypothetical protein